MALDNAALLEVLEAMQAAGVEDRVRTAAQTIYQAKLDGAVGLVMGAEGEGLRRLTQETCDLLVSIPMLGSVESLNVSVASGVCLYEARRRRLSA